MLTIQNYKILIKLSFKTSKFCSFFDVFKKRGEVEIPAMQIVQMNEIGRRFFKMADKFCRCTSGVHTFPPCKRSKYAVHNVP